MRLTIKFYPLKFVFYQVLCLDPNAVIAHPLPLNLNKDALNFNPFLKIDNTVVKHKETFFASVAETSEVTRQSY